MQIVNHQLIDGATTLDLPHLPTSASLTVWRVPLDYRANGLFVAVKPPGSMQEVPACDHGAPAFVADLPVHPETLLQNLKSVQWEAIKAERDRRKGLGVKVGGHWFHSDDPSRIQQLALMMMGANLPVNLQWKTLTREGNVFVTMTPEIAGGLFTATATSDQAIFAVAEAHRAEMEASADPSGYIFSGGWPASFEDAI